MWIWHITKGRWPFHILSHSALIWGRMCIKVYIFGFLVTRRVIWYACWHNWGIFQIWPLFDLWCPLPKMPGSFERQDQVKNVPYPSGNLKTLSNLCLQDLVTGPTGWSSTIQSSPPKGPIACYVRRTWRLKLPENVAGLCKSFHLMIP